MSDGYWLYPLSICSGSESDLSWGRRDEKSNQVEGTCHRLAGEKVKVKVVLAKLAGVKKGTWKTARMKASGTDPLHIWFSCMYS